MTMEKSTSLHIRKIVKEKQHLNFSQMIKISVLDKHVNLTATIPKLRQFAPLSNQYPYFKVGEKLGQPSNNGANAFMPLQISSFSSYCIGANEELTHTNIEHMKVIV